ncbi:MAG: hypothetical protein LBD99_06950 [Candidatus Margulisbacteria bacterium]|jgi:glycopeptide antibiotics resistance protein|nr:hypothetical protein [Candidatus Margulisiibacteriota bacterium]
MLGLDPAILEALKIIGHFAMPAVITISLIKMRFHPVFCIFAAFFLISSKEIVDFYTLAQVMEYDDLLLNLCGSALGYVSAA